jgi:hypothetical protein
MSIESDRLAIERELGIEGDDDEFGFAEDIGDDDGYSDDIFGEDDDDSGGDVGRRRKRRGSRRRRGVSGRQRIRVRAPGNVGTKRVWHLPCTADLTLVAAAAGTLVFTPNRNVSIIDMVLGTYTAAAITRAATYPEALSITNISVQGRSQFPGAGNVPVAAFLADAARRYGKLDWENCMASQSIIVSITNRDAATTHIVTGCLVVETVW